MAFRLELLHTGSTPYVLVDEEKGYMQFKGESFHENVIAFYRPVTDWLKTYLLSDFSVFVFDCELLYFNSSTAKLLYNMLIEMDEHADEHKKIIVNWIALAQNDIIVECGSDFRDEMNRLEFNIILH